MGLGHPGRRHGTFDDLPRRIATRLDFAPTLVDAAGVARDVGVIRCDRSHFDAHESEPATVKCRALGGFTWHGLRKPSDVSRSGYPPLIQSTTKRVAALNLFNAELLKGLRGSLVHVDGRPGSAHARSMDEQPPHGGFRARLHQAQGMVSAQAQCSVDEAMIMISDRATVTGLTLDEIADAVIDRTIRFGE